MKAYERLLKYVAVSTASDEKSHTVPTSARQFVLAKALAEEMKELGISDVRVDERCYVYGRIKAAPGYEDRPKIGWIAHMDTSPDFSGEGVKPQILKDYDGGDVALGTSGRTLRVKDFPHLSRLRGRTLITTDGSTLLGSDDKSGIAEILTAAERLIHEGRPHGTVGIAFTPDEEVGAGADYFDVEGFGMDYAYTVDGGEEGEIVYENFNAASAKFYINGFNVHPGSAKNTMRNAQLIAMKIQAMLPGLETPEHTEGYEGFYHLCSMEGNVESAVLTYIVRDHDSGRFEGRKETLRHIEKVINENYGEGTARLILEDQYRNMAEKIRPCFHLVETAREVILSLGLKPLTFPERGGTDGARLSFMGLPCPNLGTGGYAFHGPYEHVTLEGMELSVEIILGIIEAYAKKDRGL